MCIKPQITFPSLISCIEKLLWLPRANHSLEKYKVISHCIFPSKFRLIEFEMDYAVEEGSGAMAKTVEECACPVGYIGTSCEHCDEGYYRARTFPYLGVCVPCQCNGHAETCDMSTGQCLVCMNMFGLL